MRKYTAFKNAPFLNNSVKSLAFSIFGRHMQPCDILGNLTPKIYKLAHLT